MSKVNTYISPRVRKDGLARVHFTIHHEGKRFRIYSNILVPAASWDPNNHRLKGRSILQHKLNKELDRITTEIMEYLITSTLDPEVMVDSTILSRFVKPKEAVSKKHSAEEYIEQFLQHKSQMVARRTIQRYEAMFNHLRGFVGKSIRSSTVKVFDQSKLESFVRHMQKDKKLQVVTVKKYVGYFGEFVEWLKMKDISLDINTNKVHLKPVEQIQFSLTWNEFNTIVKAQLSENAKLDRTRDLFCFAVYTGQRYSDVIEIRKSDIIDNVWHLVSKKTQRPIKIPLVQPAAAIIEKYSDYDKQFVLPKISNQKVNKNLKELAKELGLNRPVKQHKQVSREADVLTKPLHEHLSFHDARRTFVTLSRSKSMDVELVTSVTGHKNHKTYQRYHALETKTVRNALETVFEDPGE